MFVEDYIYPDMLSPEKRAEYEKQQKDGTLKRPSLWATVEFNSAPSIDDLRKTVI